MASFWEKNGLNIFFSGYQEDYEEAQEVVVEEQDEGFVCLPPESEEDSGSETFIDDEYDICADAIEEIENLKEEEELFAHKEEKQESHAGDGDKQLATFKVPENKAATLAAKRRRPEVDESDLDTPTSTPSALLTPQPSTKKQKIGEGTFGKVYKMEENGEVFAVKEISALDPKAKREQAMLESVKHKHIIKYIRTFTEDDRLNIVMEFADRGSLTQMVQKAVRDPEMLHLFDEQNIWRFLNQMSSALDYLHCHKPKRILHRDLKVTLKLSTSNFGHLINLV